MTTYLEQGTNNSITQMYNYNTTRSTIFLREYGRNIQQLIEQLNDISDKHLRTQKAHAILRLMEIINPNAESPQKRWEDLFIISGHKCDINGTYPRPIQGTTLPTIYPTISFTVPIKYKYYGRHMESLLKKIASLANPKEQEEVLISIGKLMRRFSNTWNNHYISNARIAEDMQQMLPSDIILNVETMRSLPDEYVNNLKAKGKPATKLNGSSIPRKSNEYLATK